MISYTVVKSKRKTLSLSFDKQGELVVKCPTRTSETMVEDFVHKHAGWINSNQTKVRTAIEDKKAFDFSDGQFLQFFGNYFQIANGDINIAGNIIYLPLPRESRKSSFDKLLRKKAKEYLPSRVEQFSPLVGVAPTKISITGARTRWGSCSTRGSISFSRYLMCTSLELIDYVVVHELAHLKQHNHSSAFYSEVEKILPSYKGLQQELKKVKLPF